MNVSNMGRKSKGDRNYSKGQGTENAEEIAPVRRLMDTLFTCNRVANGWSALTKLNTMAISMVGYFFREISETGLQGECLSQHWRRFVHAQEPALQSSYRSPSTQGLQWIPLAAQWWMRLKEDNFAGKQKIYYNKRKMEDINFCVGNKIDSVDKMTT